MKKLSLAIVCLLHLGLYSSESPQKTVTLLNNSYKKISVNFSDNQKLVIMPKAEGIIQQSSFTFNNTERRLLGHKVTVVAAEKEATEDVYLDVSTLSLLATNEGSEWDFSNGYDAVIVHNNLPSVVKVEMENETKFLQPKEKLGINARCYLEKKPEKQPLKVISFITKDDQLIPFVFSQRGEIYGYTHTAEERCVKVLLSTIFAINSKKYSVSVEDK